MVAPRLTQSRYLVEGINGASCAVKIEAAVKRLPGVLDVSVSLSAGTITVEHTDHAVVTTSIEQQVRALGHRLAPIPAK